MACYNRPFPITLFASIALSGLFIADPQSLAASSKNNILVPSVKPIIIQNGRDDASQDQMSSGINMPRPSYKPALREKKRILYIPEKPNSHTNISTAHDKSAHYSDKDLKQSIRLYKNIFNAQHKGEFEKADQYIARLHDDTMLGHIYMHRYMHPKYSASFIELANWLQRYSDHPSASRIYSLAERKVPKDQVYTLPKPRETNHMNGSLERHNSALEFSAVSYKRTQGQERAYQALQKSVQQQIKDGYPTGALNTINDSEVTEQMSQYERDSLKIQIAFSYMIEGKLGEAYAIASPISKRSGAQIPISSWISGIISWSEKRYEASSSYFVSAARSQYTNPWMASASSYWAARAFSKLKNKNETLHWLTEAAVHHRTFYGLIANKALAIKEVFDWQIPPFTNQLKQALLANERGRRAYILAQLGMTNLATMELEAIDPDGDTQLKNALLSMAHHYKLARFLFKFGNSYKQNNGRFYDSALYPVIPEWELRKSHIIDKALIHGLIRQESKFKADAISHGGAIGLMQIMPSTAAYIMDDPRLKDDKKWTLKTPRTNIHIGESDVQSLLQSTQVNNDLFSMLIAYNAGPGNLAKWKSKIDVHDDPLLFIELLPSFETRAFIEHVMANLWIYRLQFGQEAPSLEAIIHDVWPPYRALD